MDNVTSPMFEDYKGIMPYEDRTICEVHKEIYDILVLTCQDKPEMLEAVFSLLEEVYEMGVKLCLKLADYKYEMDWDINNEEAVKLRILRAFLTRKREELERLAGNRKNPNNFLKRLLKETKHAGIGV